MTLVVGETKVLKAGNLKALEKLGSYRTPARELINKELARRASEIASSLGRQIALIVERNGRVSHVVLGTSEMLYLPDLGRFRLSAGRLRRLRLFVFLPGSEGKLKHFSNSGSPYLSGLKDSVLSPIISPDLVTDLEKLRFDILGVLSPPVKGGSFPFTAAYLEPLAGKKDFFGETLPGKELAWFHLPDLMQLDLDFEFFVADLEQRFSLAYSSTQVLSDARTILVGAYSGKQDWQASIAELAELADTAGLEVVDQVVQSRRRLDPKTLVGKGKLESIVLHALDLGVDLLVFDRELSPGQLRSITNLTELRVIDRSMLILDIFAQRAVSSEGRLQVELAQLRYSLPRLTETDTGLSRLTGGIGGRGPGETKLEVGRRRARKRISDLEKKIKKICAERDLRRERRRDRGVPVVGLVGYTNAGKSTLLNALTNSSVLAESKLFATLDPVTRRMRFPNEREVVFVDTVGFIRELPKELIAAFQATLEEIGEANVLVHLVDASNPELDHQIAVVGETLQQLGYGEKPLILVLNKSDCLNKIQVDSLRLRYNCLSISALDRVGIDQLILNIQELLAASFKGMDPGSFISNQ